MHRFTLPSLFCSCVLLAAAVPAFAQGEQASAKRVLAESGVKGGLVVHLGCGDGKLTAGLRAGDCYVVHGLDSDAGSVTRARAHLRSLGPYGPVAVEQWTGDTLPYADNVVNLAVVTDGGWQGRAAREEIMRVLVPQGVAMVRQGAEWRKTVKPPRAGTDEWTHFLHDASGNPVADDRLVGPPRRLQWSEGPLRTRSHEHTPGIASVVSSGGRLFYLVDEAPTASVLYPAEWHLVAREAYNGVLLWKRPLDQWWPRLCGWTQGPRQLHRRVVAMGDRVYATLGLHASLAALDAATGETLMVYEDTAGAEEVLWHKGVLLTSVRKVTEERTAELKTWEQLSTADESPLYTRDTTAPLLKRLRGIENKAEVTLLALDADSGRPLWKKASDEIAGMRALSLCAAGDRVFLQQGNRVVSLDLKTGKEQWARPARRLRLVCDRGAICCDGRTAMALSLDTGEPLWTQPLTLVNVRDVFVIGDSVWFGGFRPWKGTTSKNSNPAWGPYFAEQLDLATGKQRSCIEPENPGHHHRCYGNKATPNYILGGRRGTEFIDLAAGEVLWNSFARGVCTYGVMPANGLLYVPPHACGCYVTAQVAGFNALSAGGQEPAARGQEADRLEKGVAYVEVRGQSSEVRRRGEWPMYRGDGERSGFTPAAVEADLSGKWTADLRGELSAPVVAEGKVFVASTEDHRVCSLDAETGKLLWDFTTGGRVDSAPTVNEGRVLFGSHDGYVYCLRAGDGALVWRFRAAREERRIVVDGRVESVSPVPGSVLVREGVAYVTAGRDSYLDGGIDLCRLRVDTGEELSRTPVYSPDPKTDRQPPQYNRNAMPGTRSDLLTTDGDHVYLRQLVFSQAGEPEEKGSPHLLTVTDFLDDAWAHRSYWIYGTNTSLSTGCSGRQKGLLYGRLLAFNGSTLFSYGRKSVHWSNQLEDGPYRVFSVNRNGGAKHWEKSAPIQVQTMVLTADVLFVAGVPADEHAFPGEASAGKGALLLALSTADGKELSRRQLDKEPVFDGMAAAYGRLYVSCVDGKVVCLAG